MRRAQKVLKLFTLGLVASTLAIGLVGGSAPSAHAVHTTAPAVFKAGLDDFTFDSYHADFTLGRNAEGRSTLHTTERFVARFPDFDQNRGFIRSIPIVYNGFSHDIIGLSVTDETGADRPFDYEYAGDFVDIIMAVPEGEFVHGEQTYVLDFTQQDVTAYFSDNNADEFYWDLNGTDSRQPYGTVSATLALDDGLESAWNGGLACYRGVLGSDTECAIQHDGGTTFSVSEQGLGPGENVSMAVGFAPGTFAPAPEENRISEAEPYTYTPFTNPFGGLFGGLPVFLWGGLTALAGAIAAFITARVRRRRGARTGRAIIAQYDPPHGISVALAAEIVRASSKSMTATILDFAVRRKLRLLHDVPSNVHGVQAIDSLGLLPTEKRAYDSIFVPAAELGAVLWFDAKSTRLGDAAAKLREWAKNDAKAAGYYKTGSRGANVAMVIFFIVAVGLLLLHVVSRMGFVGLIVFGTIGIIVLVWTAILSALAATFRKPVRTLEGSLLHDYLMGLKEFIRLAEADRIRMLQSASGAVVDENRIVQVYERLLPYAVIFGYEDEWQAELAKYYRESPPEWIAGDSSFSHAVRFSALNSVISSSPVTRTVSSGRGFSSGGSFSSSSSGSSGGGFSGGGGGGGGSRGI